MATERGTSQTAPVSPAAMPLAVYGSSVSAAFADQVAFAREVGVRLLEFDRLDGTCVADLSSEHIDRIRRVTAEAGLRILSVRTDLGLSAGPLAEDAERFERYVWAARILGSPFVLMQTYWGEAQGNESRQRFSTICKHIRQLLTATDLMDITVCVRNAPGMTCQTSLDLLRFLETVDVPHLRAIFDPANAALVGEVACGDGFPLLTPHLAYLLARDFDPGAGIFVPPGEGLCQWENMLNHLRGRDPPIPLSLDASVTSLGGEDRGRSLTRGRAGMLALQGIMRSLFGVPEGVSAEGRST